jgi:outer membrane protein OmpA-like peptidoglycan-associated protein
LVTPVPVATQRTGTGGYIVVSPNIRSEGAVTATSSVGFEEVVGGSLGAEETTSRTQSWQRSFRVDLIVPRPQVPTPRVTTYTTDAHFAVNEHRLLEGGERHIIGWFEGLPADVRQKVEAGTTQIVLRGHASTTQPGPENRKLSERRVKLVREVLSGRTGSNARFQEFAFGEYRARTPDQVEAIEERRVEIEVTDQRP